MAFKLFSALHEGKGTNSFSSFTEKKFDGMTLWVSTLLPFRGEKARQIRDELTSILETELRQSLGDAENTETKFEAALKKANEFLTTSLEEQAEDVLRSGALLLALLNEDELLVSSFGQGEVFLLRDRSLIEVSDGLSPSRLGDEFFQNISSGDLQNGDKLVLSTFRLQRYITERQLIHYLEDGVTEAMEAISTPIESTEAGSLFLLNVKAIETLPFPEDKKPAAKALPFKKPQLAGILAPAGQKLKQLETLPRPSKKQAAIMAISALGIFLVFALVNILSGDSENQTNGEYSDFVTNVQAEFDNVDTRLLEGKADQANMILDRIEEQAQKMLLDRVDVVNAEEILRIAKEKREQINRIMRIKNPDIMTDLAAAKTGIVAKGLFFFNNELLAFDTNELFRVLLSGSDPESVGSISATDEVVLGTPITAKDEFVFATKTGSVIEFRNEQASSAITADDTWKPVTDMEAFSKFLYFLDPSASQIWKYERRDSGFTLPEGWVADNTDLSKAVAFAIDGSVYVLTSEGELIKFHRGTRTDFTLKDVPEGKLSGDRIFTNEELSEIFVLDRAEKKIYVLSKSETEAVYQKQIILENTESLVDIYVREGRVFVLGEQKIYEVKL